LAFSGVLLSSAFGVLSMLTTDDGNAFGVLSALGSRNAAGVLRNSLTNLLGVVNTQKKGEREARAAKGGTAIPSRLGVKQRKAA
jgi:hypothetical protein